MYVIRSLNLLFQLSKITVPRVFQNEYVSTQYVTRYNARMMQSSKYDQ